MSQNTIKKRRQNYKKISHKLSEIGSEEISELLKNSEEIHSGIGGRAVKIEIEGIMIFAKEIALTDLEIKHPKSTANLFELPTYYQYGVGSTGFSAWRELEAHQMTTGWVLNGECENFPLLYDYKIIKKSQTSEFDEEKNKLFDHHQEYWGNSQAIRNRLEAINSSSHSIILFLENIPQNLEQYLRPKVATGKRDMEMLEKEIKTTTSFMESKNMIHFDGHSQNILTDGENIYFTDFGLATSLDFELSPKEREFFEKHRNYDMALSLYAITWQPRTENGEEIHGLPEVDALSQRYKSMAQRMFQFLITLRKDLSKNTEFPNKEMKEEILQLESSGSFLDKPEAK